MRQDAFTPAAGAGEVGGVAPQIGRRATKAAGAGNHPAEPIHLPDIPGDDVGKIQKRAQKGRPAKLGLIVFHHGDEDGFPGQQQVVALPFIGVGAHAGLLGGFEPLAAC